MNLARYPDAVFPLQKTHPLFYPKFASSPRRDLGPSTRCDPS
jgi:hypothetical protein